MGKKKTFMGRTFEGIHRTTFLVNDEACVVKTYLKVKAKSHPIELVEEINTQKSYELNFLKQLQQYQ